MPDDIMFAPLSIAEHVDDARGMAGREDADHARPRRRSHFGTGRTGSPQGFTNTASRGVSWPAMPCALIS
jgi:hypothetical protein